MSLKITIPKPCHENWEGMTPDETGRFCSLCAKSVVDFTAMPRPEVETYLLANADKKVCGRFNSSQLHPAPKTKKYFSKMALAGFLLSASATLNSCVMGTTSTARTRDKDKKGSGVVADSPAKKHTLAKGNPGDQITGDTIIMDNDSLSKP